MQPLPVSQSRDAGRCFLAARAKAARVPRSCRGRACCARPDFSSHSPLTTCHCSLLIDTRCHSETAVTYRKQTIRVHPNRHKISPADVESDGNRVRVGAGGKRHVDGVAPGGSDRGAAIAGVAGDESARDQHEHDQPGK